MLHSKISEKYLYYFYLLGLGFYNPRDNSPSKGCVAIQRSIPSFCFLLITILSGICAFDTFPQTDITLNDYLFGIYIVLLVITLIVAFKRTSFLRGNTKYIWNYLVELEKMLSNRHRVDINFEKFFYRYTQKLVCMVFLFGCLAAIKLIRIRQRNFFRQVGNLNLVFITLGVNLHILFYIDLFNFIFESFNQHTMKSIGYNQTDTFIAIVKKPNFTEQLIRLFQIMKLIHFKFWKITALMNSDFGASLILLMINCTNTAIQTFYWVVIELYEDEFSQDLRIISMYCQRKLFFFSKIK